MTVPAIEALGPFFPSFQCYVYSTKPLQLLPRAVISRRCGDDPYGFGHGQVFLRCRSIPLAALRSVASIPDHFVKTRARSWGIPGPGALISHGWRCRRPLQVPPRLWEPIRLALRFRRRLSRAPSGPSAARCCHVLSLGTTSAVRSMHGELPGNRSPLLWLIPGPALDFDVGSGVGSGP